VGGSSIQKKTFLVNWTDSRIKDGKFDDGKTMVSGWNHMMDDLDS